MRKSPVHPTKSDGDGSDMETRRVTSQKLLAAVPRIVVAHLASVPQCETGAAGFTAGSVQGRRLQRGLNASAEP
jgi:hypothetical protein